MHYNSGFTTDYIISFH